MAYDSSVRQRAISALRDGHTVRQVASDLGITTRTLRRWRAALPEDEQAEIVRRTALKKQADLGELIYGYLTTSLPSLTAQLRVMGDPVWIDRQNAREIAILHGMLWDRALRILTLLQR